MNLNPQIVDQRVRGLADELNDFLSDVLRIPPTDDPKRRSVAFVHLVLTTVLDLTDDEAKDAIVEGGGDFGVDAVAIGDVDDVEFNVTLVQAKYKHDLKGDAHFPQNAVEKMILAVRSLFDPDSELNVNDRLRRRLEEIRSLVRDGLIPRVRVLLCNNGLLWTDVSQTVIDSVRFPDDQVRWDHVNHDAIVRLLQKTPAIDETLRLTGKAIVEDLDYCRILVGRIAVRELAELFDRHGDKLLERNVRRFLGLPSNRVNQEVARTLLDDTERSRFYFYNNGVTLICDKFVHNALQGQDYSVRVNGLQVINGGQTCKTIQETLARAGDRSGEWNDAYVLVRLHELPKDDTQLIHNITIAANTQTPVDLRDLKSNDQLQKALEFAIRDLGYQYMRRRGDASAGAKSFTSTAVAEAVLAIWRRLPQRAKFHGREYFGKFYSTIFNGLNGAQAVLAVLIFRLANEQRRNPPADATADIVAYGTCFLAMLMGRYLLADLELDLSRLDHREFARARAMFEERGAAYFQRAVPELEVALGRLHNGADVSRQRFAAAFRRGDLLALL